MAEEISNKPWTNEQNKSKIHSESDDENVLKNPVAENARRVQNKYEGMSLEEIYAEGKAMEEIVTKLEEERDNLPENDLQIKYLNEIVNDLRMEVFKVYEAVTYLEYKQYDDMSVSEILQKAQELRQESRAMQAGGIVDEYNESAVHEWEMGKQQLADHLVDIASEKTQKQEYEEKRKAEQGKEGTEEKSAEWDGKIRGVGDLNRDHYAQNSANVDINTTNDKLQEAEKFDNDHPETNSTTINPKHDAQKSKIEVYKQKVDEGR